MKRSLAYLIVLLMAIALVGGCADLAPKAESDSDQNFGLKATIPVDDNVYIIEGRVIAEAARVLSVKQRREGQ